MKKKALIIWIVCIIILACFFAYQSKVTSGKIYLYGEPHGISAIVDEEFKTWSKYYHEEEMRHLFIEWPYYDAQMLNLWLKAEDDKLLDVIFEAAKGTAGGTYIYRYFFERIKRECPKTVFHGTDVGHKYSAPGERYLSYLRQHGKENAKEYKRTKEVMEQGEKFYETMDHTYREDMMAKNFEWEFEQLKGESVMGIYGEGHVIEFDNNHLLNQHKIMADQLLEKYQGRVYAVDLVKSSLNQELPEEVLEIAGKRYKTDYYGEMVCYIEEVGCNTAKIWRLKEGEEDFVNAPVGETTLGDSKCPIVGYYGTYVFDLYRDSEFIERKLFHIDMLPAEDGTNAIREILY